MLSARAIKIIFIIIAFLEATILGLVPLKSSKFRESPMILGIANAFSGGVFLAIAFMHIMPEQTHTWMCMQYIKNDCGLSTKATPFNLPFFLLVVGYTLILVIDKVLFDTHAILGHDEEGHVHINDGSKVEVEPSNRGSMLR